MLKSHKSCRIFDCSSFPFISRKLKDFFLLTAKGASNKILRKKIYINFILKKRENYENVKMDINQKL